ncbi:MAG TPA: TadE/TadG family type IV pilus assembly protein [Rhizomicrobium sp.]
MIEFAIVAPVFLLFILGIIETGAIFFGQSTLFYATQDIARQVRTGQISGTITASTLKSDICANVAGMITTSQCNANLQVDMRAFNSFGGASFPPVTNANGTLNAGAMTVQAVGACQIVLVRSFYPWSIITPMLRPMLQTASNGTHLLYSAIAFRTEPYASNPC